MRAAMRFFPRSVSSTEKAAGCAKSMFRTPKRSAGVTTGTEKKDRIPVSQRGLSPGNPHLFVHVVHDVRVFRSDPFGSRAAHRFGIALRRGKGRVVAWKEHSYAPECDFDDFVHGFGFEDGLVDFVKAPESFHRAGEIGFGFFFAR